MQMKNEQVDDCHFKSLAYLIHLTLFLLSSSHSLCSSTSNKSSLYPFANTFKMQLGISIIFVALLNLSSLAFTDAESDVQNRLRIIHGFQDCGSVGEILQVIGSNCSVTPCQLQIGKTYQLAAYFKLKDAHTSLAAEMTVKSGDVETNVLKVVTPTDVEAGMIATFGYPLQVTRALGLGLSTIKVTVGGTGSSELCFTVDANIHE